MAKKATVGEHEEEVRVGAALAVGLSLGSVVAAMVALQRCILRPAMTVVSAAKSHLNQMERNLYSAVRVSVNQKVAKAAASRELALNAQPGVPETPLCATNSKKSTPS